MGMLTQKEIRKQEDFKVEIFPFMNAMYNFALQFTSDPDDAKDLVQDTIIKAYRFFDSFEKGTNGKSWVFRILRNTHINNFRKYSKQADLVQFDEEIASTDLHLGGYMSITDHNEHRLTELLGDEVSIALDDLPENFRTVVLLCDVDDYTYEEIANMLDVPIGTVRSRLHRGRSLLKAQLYKLGHKRGFGKQSFN